MPNCATLWTVARQAPLSMGFSRQGYWSGLPCSPPGDLPDPGIEPWSLMSTCIGRRLFLLLAPPGKPMDSISHLTGNTFTFNFGIIFQCFFFFFFNHFFLWSRARFVKLQTTRYIRPAFCFCKYSMMEPQTHSFMYCVWLFFTTVAELSKCLWPPSLILFGS